MQKESKHLFYWFDGKGGGGGDFWVSLFRAAKGKGAGGVLRGFVPGPEIGGGQGDPRRALTLARGKEFVALNAGPKLLPVHPGDFLVPLVLCATAGGDRTE